MPVRWLSSLLLVGVAAVSMAADTPHATRGDTRVLRAGDGALQIEVIGASDEARTAELHRWAAEAANAVLAAFGRFPLRSATVFIEQQPSQARSPVPWGQTSRRDGVAVYLYVRENASFDELRGDWTAVHELAHLFHPYLGDDGRWLAEGLASYYQNVLRARVGLLDEAEAWRRLDAGFGRGRRESSGLPLDELSRRHRGTMRVYWAGAAYWLEADLALRRDGSSLDDVLEQYARCCLRSTSEVRPERFAAQLDTIAGREVFAPLFRRYARSTEFPSLDAAYAALGIESSADALQFAGRGDAARLRRAVMGRRATR
ncbi:MAG TPA: hypothetical protein VJ484_09060 [Lysobacter sp.]|nr:hypothetical protein [Lysobacter sp.]